MKRDLQALARGVADVVVIGAGIYGAAIAREAALRGLDVRLVERDDFGGATSSNSHHIIHGGMRYLQHGDVARVLESIRERHSLSRIAPHLVRPQPVVIPTYGHGLRGRELLVLGAAVHRALELATGHRERLVRPGLPPGPLSKSRVLELLPGIQERGLTGGVLLYDSQVTNSERLTLAMLRSAVDAGANIANYVEAQGFRHERGRLVAVALRDRIHGETTEIASRAFVNATGPWAPPLARLAGSSAPPRRFARALNLVTREIFSRVGAGLYAGRHHHDSSELLGRGQRLLFLVPWRGRTILGTDYAPHADDPAALGVRRADVERLLDGINEACPAARLTIGDVALVHCGLLPAAATSARTGEPEIDKHYRIVDHASDGAAGLVSVIGVKYTTARDVAERTVDLVVRSCRMRASRSTSAEQPLPGAEFGADFESYLAAELARARGDRAAFERLVRNHGARHVEVLRHLEPSGEDPSALALLRAEVRHAAREEMALTLADIVLRRSDVGAAGHPGADLLAAAARFSAEELGWSRERTADEIAAVERRYAIGG
jgi:glycerol-3-phosphate dehydrogenase